MSEHRAFITWSASTPDFCAGKYSREHTWRFDGGATIVAAINANFTPGLFNPVSLVISVPEPGRAALALLGGLALRRRRKR